MLGSGIVAYGSHIPFWRLQTESIGTALGRRVPRRVRAVASYDEDTTTLAVESSRVALSCAPASVVERIDALVFATATPVYADKTNATAIHAALSLPANVRASDSAGSTRGGVASLAAALRSRETTLVAMSDVGSGPAGSPLETDHGDAGASFVVGESDDVVAQLIGIGSISDEIEDRWRVPGAPWSKYWEERFAEGVYRGLGEESFTLALKSAGISPAEVTHLAVTGVSPRAAAQLAKVVGVDQERVADDLSRQIGYTGAAHPGILLASVLDTAEPGDVIALVSLVDGADTVILRATPALEARRSTPTVQAQIAGGNTELSYLDFLIWKGQVEPQMPRRPEPERVAAPPAHRDVAWKFSFEGSACTGCGTRHLPPQDVCLRCGAVLQMEKVNLARVAGTIATYTVDHLAFSPAPPVVAAIVDFDGGGRFSCELTDVDAESVAVGQRVSMTFRRISTADGVANYFWKARPLGGE
jgi:hydroxymethylglutaryl-CoA synthase